MKRLMMLVSMVPVLALLTGCPEDEKKETPSAPSASASVPTPVATPATASVSATATVSAAPVADAAAPVDAGKVADAGKTDAAAPKK